MRLQAEVHCYHCGQTAGIWEWPSGVPPTWGLFHAAGSAGWSRPALHKIRCPRCGGPVFLDEAAPVAPQRPVAIPPARRGRPRRQIRELAS
jgi:DNA-directed RNA polymerase subunit RPC12/RpoP